MPEKYLPGDGFVTTFLAQAMTDAGKFDEIYDKKNFGEPLEICMTIDGVEVSFIATVRHFYKFYEEELKTKAADLLQEKLEFRPLLNLIEEFEWKMKEKLKEVFDLQGL